MSPQLQDCSRHVRLSRYQAIGLFIGISLLVGFFNVTSHHPKGWKRY